MDLVILMVILLAMGVEKIVNTCLQQRRDNRWFAFQLAQSVIRGKYKSDVVPLFHDRRWEYIIEMTDDLKYVFGSKWLEILRKTEKFNIKDQYDSDNGSITTPWSAALELWYSKQGMVTDQRLGSGYDLEIYDIPNDPEWVQEMIKAYGIEAETRDRNEDRQRAIVINHVSCRLFELIGRNVMASHSPTLNIELKRSGGSMKWLPKEH